MHHRSTRLTPLLVTGLAAALTLTTACQSRITGKEGNLEFSYTAPGDAFDFNKPIAVGARLDVKVHAAGGGPQSQRTVTIESADSNDPEVLAVHGFSSNTIVLEGVSAGGAEISTSAKLSSGEVVSDAVDMRAAVPERLEMHHYCTGGAEGLYLVGQEVWIPFRMKLNNGQDVIGYGYHPIDIEPADGVTIDQTAKDQAHFHLTTAATPGDVTLSSQIDDTTLTLKLVEEGDIDGAILADGSEHVRTRVGGTSFVHVYATIADKPVCQARTAREVTSDTPDICTVSVADPETTPGNIFNETGWVAIAGKAVGTCQFTITHPDANGGEGVSNQFSVEVEEAHAGNNDDDD